VVDEKPDAGADATYAGIAAALADRGFDAARIAFFPGWSGDEPSGAHRRFVASFDDAVLAHGGVRCHQVSHDCRVEELYAATDAAGRPRLGARTFRCAADHAGDGPIRLTFAGLGRYGRERADAAREAATTGTGPHVLGLRRGYLVTSDAGPPDRAADRAD
jgi:hypothetical protein